MSITGAPSASALEIENARLLTELDALRQRATGTPQHQLRSHNERMQARLNELERADKTRAQMGFEIAELKLQLQQLESSGDGSATMAGLHKQVKVSKWISIDLHLSDLRPS